MKLTDQQVNTIKQSKASNRTLASRYNVSIKTIQAIKRGIRICYQQ
jgi:transposase